MKLSLVVLTAGKAQGQAIPVKLSQFIIGRDPQCNLRPASALISKRHCALLIKSGQVFVRDFDSTNGTFVNDEPVKGEVPIKHEDVLKVGPLTFRIQIEGQPSVSKPTPPPQPATHPDDDAAAALLLGLTDEGVDASAEDSEVPAGSTVFDMQNPIAETDAGGGDKSEAKKPDPKAQAVSASKAAEALLAKYTRRQR
jgi:pSer/pThr/pTyr-binding forkhead associated (FHA) protein